MIQIYKMLSFSGARPSFPGELHNSRLLVRLAWSGSIQRTMRISKKVDSSHAAITSRGGSERWATVGASTNISEASWQALADAVEYGLIKHAG